MKRTRCAALCAAVVLAVAVIGSIVFIAEYTHHDCVGEGCPVCGQLQVAQTVVYSLGLAAVAAAGAFCVRETVVRPAERRGPVGMRMTLVELKVELLN